jgi:hypothetical protein
VNVTRSVVLRVRYEKRTPKTARCHRPILT